MGAELETSPHWDAGGCHGNLPSAVSASLKPPVRHWASRCGDRGSSCLQSGLLGLGSGTRLRARVAGTAAPPRPSKCCQVRDEDLGQAQPAHLAVWSRSNADALVLISRRQALDWGRREQDFRTLKGLSSCSSFIPPPNFFSSLFHL